MPGRRPSTVCGSSSKPGSDRRRQPVSDREQDVAVKDGEGEPAAPWAAAAAGLRAGKCLRAVAVDLFGAERVDAEWTPEGPMRATVRRLARRARDEARAPGDGTRPRRPGRR